MPVRTTRITMSYDETIFQMYLGQVPMFQACSEDEMSAVAYLASPRTLEAGTAIVREGETGDEFFVLMMGTAAVGRQGTTWRAWNPVTTSASSRSSILRRGTPRSLPTFR
jgi:hypothetical protein